MEKIRRKDIVEKLETLVNTLENAKKLVKEGKAGIEEIPYEEITFVDTFGLVQGVPSINFKPSVVIVKLD